MSCLLPPLKPGATLGLIAPAGPPRTGSFERVPGLLHQMGFAVRVFPGCHGPAHLEHLAASDARRLADLHDALDDAEVDALLALRGGYGCIRLLPGLDLDRVRRASKPLIGYSDLTTLHGVWARCGLPAWHAPMPASDWVQPGGEADAERLAKLLLRGVWAGDTQQAPAPHPLSQGGQAQGPLLGGNLSVLVSSLGTVAMPELRGAILFLEEIAEDPYRVDRLLTQLLLAGVLEAVAGFVLGSFSEAESADAVLADRLLPLGKPVLAGWPAGHGQPNHALPLGLRVQLDVPSRTLRW